MTLTLKLDLDNVEVNISARCLGHKSFTSEVIVETQVGTGWACSTTSGPVIDIGAHFQHYISSWCTLITHECSLAYYIVRRNDKTEKSLLRIKNQNIGLKGRP